MVPLGRPTATQRILVIDDDYDIRAMLELALELNGYQVVTAANGQEGLDCLRLRSQGPFSVILLDLMMPIMNGYQFLEHLRADPHLAAIPVIMMTGFDDVLQPAAALGIARHLQKPIELNVLLRLIAGYP